MKIIAAKNAEQMGALAADIVENRLANKPDMVLGTVTGASPEGMYRELVRRHRDKALDFSRVRTINTDEYLGLPRTHPQSYRYYLANKFFIPCGIPEQNTAVPNGVVSDPEAECERYEAFCRANPVDLQILGVGLTGHIGFNEPDESFYDKTHVVSLAEETIRSNSVYFGEDERMPTQAITVGIGVLMQAKEILLLISGKAKAEIAYSVFCDAVSPKIPATVLRFHRNVTAIIDEDALSVIKEKAPSILK